MVLSPQSAEAFERNFAAGTLIIPVDSVSQTEVGAMASYGLIYRLLEQGVTVHVIINSKKTAIDAVDVEVPSVARVNNSVYVDHVVTASPFQNPNGRTIRTDDPDTEANEATPVGYIGAPWLVDATEADRAVSLLAKESKFALFRDESKKYVEIHQAQIEFIADVSSSMNTPPPAVALLGEGAVNVLRKYLDNAGLGLADCPECEGCWPGSRGCSLSSRHGTVYDVLSARDDFATVAGYPHGHINAIRSNGEPYYTVMWAPHWIAKASNRSGMTRESVQNILENIAFFADAGHGIFAECASIESFEGSFKNVKSTHSTDGGEVTEVGYPDGTVFPGGVCLEDADCAEELPCLEHSSSGVKTCMECKDDKDCADDEKCLNTKDRCSKICTYDICVPASEYTSNKNDQDCSVCQAMYGTGGSAAGTFCATQTECQSNLFCHSHDYDGDSLTICEGCLVDADCGSGYACRTDDPNVGLNYCVATTAPSSTGSDDDGADWTAFSCRPGCDCSMYHRHVSGHGSTRFMSHCGVASNGLNANFPQYDTDSMVFRNVTSPLVQLGDWPFEGTGGHIHNWKPMGQDAPHIGYNSGVIRFISSSSPDADRHGWDFYTFLPANADGRGPIAYLAGHTYAKTVAGTRLVLNTMFQLQLELTSVELARSSPSVYEQKTPELTVILLGTYMQTSPPGAATWLQSFNNTDYDSGRPGDWRFPYHPGNLRSFEDFPLGVSVFGEGTVWNAGYILSQRSPASRTVFTTIGESRVPFLVTSLGGGCADENSNGACDLAEALGLDGEDPEDYHDEKHLISMVRGHCMSHTGGDKLAPADAECDDLDDDNRPALGGIDRSTPAFVKPNSDIPGGADRPVVAVVGARDGQVHAFYVTGGPPSFTKPPEGTELWSYIPEAQLPLLSTNSASVDASPLVIEADIDIDGVGGAEPRTILVMASGETTENIFALDVTDPTQEPSLLWSIVRGTADDHFKKSAIPPPQGHSEALKYGASNVEADTTADAEELYDYSDLGHAFSLEETEIANHPVVIAATNFGPGTAKKLEVFAIDLVTGARVWQFERTYTSTTCDNTIPGGVALLDANDDGIDDSVLVGDMEGRLWEIEVETGQNPNVIDNYDYALLDTDDADGNQPVTSKPGVEVTYLKTLIAVGTGGADWVSSTERGMIHLLNYKDRRSPGSAAKQKGLCNEADGFPFELEVGERVYGAVHVVGGEVLATTSFGRLGGDLTESALDGGRFINVGVGGAIESEMALGKAAGGVAITETETETSRQVTVYAASVKKKGKDVIEVAKPPPPPRGLRILGWREIPLN